MIIENFNNFGQEARDIKEKLFSVLENKEIAGVSAPELNIPYKILAIKNYPGKPWMIAFNPRIVYSSDVVLAMHETCYSYPGLKVRINRPKSIRVRFADENGAINTLSMEDALARLFQHEMVHMEPDGIFWNDASYLYKNKAIKDWKALTRKLRRE